MSATRRAGAELLRLIERPSDPPLEADRVITYAKDVNGVTHLFAVTSNGVVYQLTGESMGSTDAFGRQRVSEPTTIFDSKMITDALPLIWDDQQVSGAGTASAHQANRAAVLMSVSNVTAGTRVRQTFRRFNYQPGKSQLFMFTSVFGAGAAGITRRVGQFDEDNGVFFQQSGTTLSWVVRSSTTGAPVDTVVDQASWNIDKFDGTGPSGVTLDITMAQLWFVDYEWLGEGTVSVGFVVDRQIFYAHQFNFANVINTVYMSNPNNPMRYELSNNGAGPAATLTHICSTVISEGGRLRAGAVYEIDRNDVPLVTLNNNALYPLLAIRLKAAYQYATVDPTSLSILVTSNSPFRYVLLRNPTFVGVAPTWVSLPNSAIEFDAALLNTTTVTGGTAVSGGYDQQVNDAVLTTFEEPSDLTIGSSIAGVSDILVLAVQRLSGAAETFYGAMSFRELR